MNTPGGNDRLPRKEGRGLGLLFIVSGLVLNKWSIERVVAPDEHLQHVLYIAAIVAFQLGLLALGCWLLVSNRSTRAKLLPTAVRPLVTVGLAAGVIVGVYGNLKAARVIDPNREFRASWDAMVASEELILDLGKDMKKLSSSMMNLELPDHLSRDLFADAVVVADLAPAPSLVSPAAERVDRLETTRRLWAVEPDTRVVPVEELDLWRPLIDDVGYFENAKLYIISGHYLPGRRNRYEALVGFGGLARTRAGGYLWIQARVELVLASATLSGGSDADWKIEGFRTTRMETAHTDELFFTEVLDSALEPSALARARRSIHEEMVLASLLDPENFVKPNPWFYIASVDRHPGLAVADVDGDGFDDIYVMERHTRNMLFRNRGDGTFEEAASAYGLDVEDHTSSAIFADFDNDGDPDVFLGRTLAPSMYLENTGGRFVDRSPRMESGSLPYFVSSVNAVDFNDDGLLDVYFSTYAAQMINATEGRTEEALGGYLSSEDIGELERLLRPRSMGNKRLNFPGPPNVLLENRGQGRFVVASASEELRVFRNTYQSTWADFDDDGDPDVYLANDFAPNNLFRNDGSGRFVDVTADTGTADIGFGMGASWGDYDNDGRQDLYVSNMYSKAGRRITEQLGTLDPRFGKMARGNSLFRNRPDGFEKVSGTEAPSLLVENAGWSWGGQFIDFDNDGDQDIYALSGHYTAPKEIDSDVDI